MDTFFTQKNCDRCGKPLTGGRTMSMLSGIPDNIDYQESNIIKNQIFHLSAVCRKSIV